MRAELIERAEALADRAASAFYAAAHARAAGLLADAEAWESRAERLDNMARDYRAKAN